MALRVALVALLAACGDPLAGLDVVGSDPSDAPIAGLDAEWRARFDEGDVRFEEVFRDATGLGPTYIRHACSSCHADDARGPGVVETFVVVGSDGFTPAADQGALPWGHTARPHVAGGAVTPVAVPEVDDLLVSTRVPPAVFARGYLEAVADEEIWRLADEQAAEGVVSGRPNLVPWRGPVAADPRFHDLGPGDTAIGRFGLKARSPTLDDFVADAYRGDMSITSPLRPDEAVNPDGLVDDLRPGTDIGIDVVDVVADYVRLLAVPERAGGPGADVFAVAGCAACHVPTLRTRDDWPVTEMAGIDAPIYSDLLLHDLGPDHADGVVEGLASTSEWRAAPLIGLRHLRSLMHDGSAETVEQAIAAHGGPGSEANASVAAFEDLSAADRALLLAFVASL